MSKLLDKYEVEDPKVFERHPLHAESFFDASEKKKHVSYHESIRKYTKIKSVVYVESKGKKLIIDGWGYVCYAIENGISEVVCQRLDITRNEDIHQVMLELQFSDHNSPEQEYKIYEAAYTTFSRGKGYRTDLAEKEDKKDTEGKKVKRRPTIYEKIAEMTNAPSAKRVQYLLFIGRHCKPYFEKMVEERVSLNTAYYTVKNVQDGKYPEVPPVKKIVYVVSMTDLPTFTTSNNTAETPEGEEEVPTNEQVSGSNTENVTDIATDVLASANEQVSGNGERHEEVINTSSRETKDVPQLTLEWGAANELTEETEYFICAIKCTGCGETHNYKIKKQI